MSNSVVGSINLACTVEPRDFSEEQKQYILNNQSLRDDLMFWLESTVSDNCWTPANFDFIKSLYSNTGKNCIESTSAKEPQIDIFASSHDQGILFVLEDCVGGEDKLEGRIKVGSTRIELFINGYGTSSMEPGFGSPIYIEFYQGSLRLLVWDDINQEEPTYEISLEGALESKRQDVG